MALIVTSQIQRKKSGLGKEGVVTVILCVTHGLQRGGRVSTLRLGSVSTRKYSSLSTKTCVYSEVWGFQGKLDTLTVGEPNHS